MRDPALEELDRLLSRYAREGDSAILTSPQATALSVALIQRLGVPDPGPLAPDMLTVLGMLHWQRYLRRRTVPDAGDLNIAIQCFLPLRTVRPQVIPEELHRYFTVLRLEPYGFVLDEQADALLQRALTVDDPPTLNAAVVITEQVLAATAADQPEHAERLVKLGVVLLARYSRAGDPADLDHSIALLERATDETAADHPESGLRQSNLAAALSARYDRLGSAGDLERAIACAERAVAGTATGNPGRGEALSNLTMLLRYRFDRWHDVAALDRALAVGAEAVAGTEAGDPELPARLINLSAAEHARYSYTQELDDLDRAVRHAKEAVASCPPGHSALTHAHGQLGGAMAARARHTGDLTAIDAAVAQLERAVSMTKPEEPNRTEWQTALLDTLILRSTQRMDATDLDRAVTITAEAVEASAPGSAHRTRRQQNHATALRVRYERTDNLADLDAAVTLSRQLVADAPDDDPGTVDLFTSLASCLLTRFDRTGDPADVDDAVAAGRRAAATVPDTHPERARILSELGTAFGNLGQRNGDAGLLDRAVRLGEQAVAATPPGSPVLAKHLSNLMICLKNRYKWSGARADIDRAIETGERAIRALPAGRGATAGAVVANTGDAYNYRYLAFGQITDVHRAIEYAERAVDLVPAHERRTLAAYRSTLASTLLTRHSRLTDPADVDRAVELAEQAVAGTMPGDVDLVRHLDNGGNAYRLRAELREDRSDADRAVELHELAIAATNDPAARSQCRCDLSISLRVRSWLTDDTADLVRAIGLAEKAVAEAGSAAERAWCLIELGRGLTDHEDFADLRRAADAFRESSSTESAPVGLRAEAADLWASAAILVPDWPEGVRAYGEAVRLLGEVAPRSLGRADQEHRLAKLSGIGSRAAATALRAGLPERAVELLEHGRNVLFAQLLEARTELADLSRAHPDLADTIDGLMRELDRPELDVGGAAIWHDADSRRRRAAYGELQARLSDVRALPGFANFLIPPPAAELLTAACDTPVVLLNVALERSDALILRDGRITVVELQDAGPERVVDQVNQFLEALNQGAEDQLTDVLGWLWDAIAGPVLAACEITRAPGRNEPWPAIHWCPAGPLAFLPIHAAGHHETRFGPQPETVLDRVISSTVPNLRTLLRTHPTAAPGSRQTLVVTMPRTPGAADLPGAAQEAALLAALLPGQAEVLGLPGTPPATRDAVLAALPGSRWAHFSCHGATDMLEPSASRLLLADHETSPLTVLDLGRARLDDAELAFLSACSTARSGVDLPDESIHLAAACLLAGFRHVIATLWPIDDTDAVTVCRGVYTSLVTGAEPVARALHDGSRALRFLYPTQPSRWAAHIHIGA